MAMAASTGLAQTREQQGRWCAGQDGAEPDQRIAACSALLDSGAGDANFRGATVAARAAAYAAHGQIDRAIADFDEAIRLNFDLATSYYNRGGMYIRKGLHQRAIEDYDQTLRLQPDYASALANRGHAYSDIRQYAKAIEDLDRAVRLRPGDSMNIFNRGNAYLRWGRNTEAIGDYDRAIGLRPDFADAYYNRALARERMGQLETAVDDYERSIALDPTDGANQTARNQALDQILARANAAAKQGLFDRAMKDYDRVAGTKGIPARIVSPQGGAFEVVIHYPFLAHALFARGVLRRRMGDAAKGEADIAQARQLNRNVDQESARQGIVP